MLYRGSYESLYYWMYWTSLRKPQDMKLCRDSCHFNEFNKWAAAWQNQQNDLCAQQRLRIALASTQSRQSLGCALTGQLRTQAFFMRTTKTLIRLGKCPGWSESSLGAQATLLVLSCGGSDLIIHVHESKILLIIRHSYCIVFILPFSRWSVAEVTRRKQLSLDINA